MAQNFSPRLLTPQLETPAETDTGENGENRATRDLFSREFLAIFFVLPKRPDELEGTDGQIEGCPPHFRKEGKGGGSAEVTARET